MNKKQIIILCMMFGVLFSITYALELTPKDPDLKIVDDKIETIYDVVSPSLEVFGTEYQVGDEGRVWLQLLRDNMPVNNASCKVNVYHPNLTKFIDNGLMFHLNGSEGLYYYDIVPVPDTTGVYMTSARCKFFFEVLVQRGANNDSYVNASDINTNYGSILWTIVGNFSDDLLTTYIRGNGSQLLGKNISEAYLGLYSWFTPTQSFNISIQVLNETWYENNITYANRPTHEPTIWSIEPTPTSTGWMIWDITNMAQHIANGTIGLDQAGFIGLVFNFTDPIVNESIAFWSKEYIVFDEELIPKLLYFFDVEECIHEIRGGAELHVSDYVNEIQNYIIALAPKELESNHDFCLDNTTLIKVLTYERLVGDDIFTDQRNETVICNYGCYKYFNTAESQGYCAPPTFNRFIFLICLVLFVLIVLILVYYVEL